MSFGKVVCYLREIVALGCHRARNLQNDGSFLYIHSRTQIYRRSALRDPHAGTIYFYLGRKSPVVMEIYRGLNIDINARQRRRPSRTTSHRRLNRDLKSLRVYRGDTRENTRPL